MRLGIGPRLMVAPGARLDHWDLTDQTTASPWMQAELTLPHRLTLRGAGGVYQQFADFDETVGAFAGTDMQPERSIHADLSVEHRLTAASRLQLTLYNRQDDEVIRRPGADTRLVSGQLVRGSPSARHANRSQGYARGVEFLLQRSSPTALSGWLSYAYGKNRYEDTATGETYWGDLDQRHTLNAYGFYRFSHKFSASVKFRMGSNFPIPGYYAQQGDRYFVADRRNTARLPSYARLDLRANRTFDWSRSRLTLFVEVLNVLNRENVRFNPPRVNAATREVTRLFDSLVPVVPSAGILFEF
jgi:outer membrane receptor for ferrienterochelin and colicin